MYSGLNPASSNAPSTISSIKSVCVLNNRIHITTGFRKAFGENFIGEVNKYISHIENYVSREFSNIAATLWKEKQQKAILNKNVFEEENYRSLILQRDVSIFQSKTSKILTQPIFSLEKKNCANYSRIFISNNSKSQHLFNQTRSFRTERRSKAVKVNNPGVCSRIKAYFGLCDLPTTSVVRKDLENFHENLIKEQMTPVQSQRVLLAFTEGYLQAKETLNQKSSSTLISRLAFASITGIVLFIAYKEGAIRFQSSVMSVDVSQSKVKFSDVKGADEAKEELKNVVEFLKNPDKYSALGGKLPKGVLLVGPPGTGKTLLAKAVAGEAGVPFFSTSGPEFDEVYVGIGAKRIRELFKLAKNSIPCVIFIDEIDSIGKERTSSTLHPYANDTINQLLSEMDGFRNTSGIIVLGATNRKNDLDKALLRPGRFDVEVNVPMPDYRGRKELLEFYLEKVRHLEVDVDQLARGTTNFTGADIENLVNQGALRAAVLGAPHVTMSHLEHARDKALMGPESMSRISDEETNRITAYHEGGHTVVAYFTQHSQPLHKVTIVQRGASLGHTAYIPDKDVYHVTKTQMLAHLDSMMGGRAAEELVFGEESITSGAASDLQKATDLATNMVARWGMSEAVGLPYYTGHNLISPKAADLVDHEVKKLLRESYNRAKSVLREHSREHKAVSEALLKYETLDAEQIKSIINGQTISDD